MAFYGNTIDPAGGVNRDGVVTVGHLRFYFGTGVFTTTGQTCVINTPFGTGDRLLAAMATPHCASGSEDQQDQPLYFTTGSSANQLTRNTTTGTLTPVTGGKATVARLASGSSGLGFSVFMVALARN